MRHLQRLAILWRLQRTRQSLSPARGEVAQIAPPSIPFPPDILRRQLPVRYLTAGGPRVSNGQVPGQLGMFRETAIRSYWAP
jgi:hypothetical protein